jgi:hypothetical protein
MSQSQGDSRVLFAMNLALSFAFSWLLFSALSFVDVVPFSWGRIAVATAILVVATHLVTR